MCRNIRVLYNFKPPATDDEIHEEIALGNENPIPEMRRIIYKIMKKN